MTKAGNWRSRGHQKKSRPTWNSRSTSATWSRIAKIVSTSPSASRVSPLRHDHLVALPDQADDRRLAENRRRGPCGPAITEVPSTCASIISASPSPIE